MTDPLPLQETLAALEDIGAEVQLYTACGSWYAMVEHVGLGYREAYYHNSLAKAAQMLRRDLAFLQQMQEGT